MQEMLASASLGFSTCPVLTQGAIEMLTQHGSPGQQATFLEKMVSGEWTGTMNLTEPQAGSDLGAVRDQGGTGGRRHVAYHRPEDLHHFRRARPGRQHHPSGPGPGARRAPGYEGHLVLHRAQVPRQRGWVAGCPQRPALRIDRAQARDSREPDVRHVVRRCQRGGRLSDRRGQPGHALHVHHDEYGPAFGRPPGPLHCRAFLSGRLALRTGARAGPGRRRPGG